MCPSKQIYQPIKRLSRRRSPRPMACFSFRCFAQKLDSVIQDRQDNFKIFNSPARAAR
jgi:hypothetical protein